MGPPFSDTVSRDDVVARIEANPVTGTPGERREGFARLATGDPGDAEAAPILIAGRGGTILYFHGGGYMFGSPRTHRRIGADLAERTGLEVVLPAYPLAPEHPWPAQLEAALAAAEGAAPPLILAGDSAGGHLALVLALELERLGRGAAGLLLFSPNTDRTGLSETRQANDGKDPMVDDAGDRQLARECFGELADDDPHVSPLLDDLSLLPPVHIEVGGEEVLLGDSLLLAERIAAAGGEVTIHVEPSGIHMMQLWARWWPVATASLERAAAFATRVTAGDTTSDSHMNEDGTS